MAKPCNNRECSHRKWGSSRHCAEMSCPNYINKCSCQHFFVEVRQESK